MAPACRAPARQELKAELAEPRRRAARRARRRSRPAVAQLQRRAGRAGELAAAATTLIQKQNWRAAHFRVAADDINYRRFFNINELAGLRMELPELFDHGAPLVLRPAARRRAGRPADRPYRRAARPQGLLALAPAREGADGRSISWSRRSWRAHEALRDDWPVEGTTGYEFANLVCGLLVDPAGEEALQPRPIADFTG